LITEKKIKVSKNMTLHDTVRILR